MRARAAGKFVSSAKLVLYLFTGIYHKEITLWLGGIHLAVVQCSPFPGYLTSLTPNSRLPRPFAVTTYLHGSQGGSSKATVPGVIQQIPAIDVCTVYSNKFLLLHSYNT